MTLSVKLALVACSFVAVVAAVMLPAAADEGDKPAAAAGTGEFETTMEEFKKIVADLNDIRTKYRTAEESERPGLEKAYKEKVAVAEEIRSRLFLAAEKKFAEKPDLESDPGKMLHDSIGQNLFGGKSADAIRVIKLLAPHVKGDLSVGLLALDAGENEIALAQLTKVDATKIAPEAREYLEKALAEANTRLEQAKKDDLPRVKIETSKGTVVVELYENEAPNTVANFISLIEEKKFYDNLVFHRVLDGFMAQGGDPTGTGGGGPGYAIPCECQAKNHRNHFLGTLSMAHAGKDTGGSQFFLTFRATSHLDGVHTAFGRVIEGHDVLAKLQRIDPNNPQPDIKPDKIVKATVVRKRDHEYKPKTLADPKP